MNETDAPQWYLGIDGEAKGPLPVVEIRALFSSGKANGKTQAWTAGMENWVEVQTLGAFKPFLTPPPMKKPGPPALPVQQKVVESAPVAVAADVSPARQTPAQTQELSPDEIIERDLGLTPEKIQSMANLAVELAGQTRVRLKLTSPPPRMGLIQRSHHSTKGS